MRDWVSFQWNSSRRVCPSPDPRITVTPFLRATFNVCSISGVPAESLITSLLRHMWGDHDRGEGNNRRHEIPLPPRQPGCAYWSQIQILIWATRDCQERWMKWWEWRTGSPKFNGEDPIPTAWRGMAYKKYSSNADLPCDQLQVGRSSSKKNEGIHTSTALYCTVLLYLGMLGYHRPRRLPSRMEWWIPAMWRRLCVQYQRQRGPATQRASWCDAKKRSLPPLCKILESSASFRENKNWLLAILLH